MEEEFKTQQIEPNYSNNKMIGWFVDIMGIERINKNEAPIIFLRCWGWWRKFFVERLRTSQNESTPK